MHYSINFYYKSHLLYVCRVNDVAYAKNLMEKIIK
jgi:hypothetical protein